MSCTGCALRQSLRPLIRGKSALQRAIGARPVASISHPLRLPLAAIFLHAYHHFGLGAGNVRCSKRWPPELMCAPISAVSHVQEMAFRSLQRLRCKQQDASDDCESNAGHWQWQLNTQAEPVAASEQRLYHLLSKRAFVAAGAMRTLMRGLDTVLGSARARHFEQSLAVAASIGVTRSSGARAARAAGDARAPACASV